MAPAIITLDNTPDFDIPAAKPTPTRRTLLLAPPSLASNESLLKKALGPHDRSNSDLHMLDRLSAGLISLPPSTYDLVLLLAGADSETGALLDRGLLSSVHDALRPGGRIEGDVLPHVNEKEFVLAGLVAGKNGFVRPDYGEGVVPLKLRRKKKEEVKKEEKVPAGVGFVSLDDFDGDDDELIDESTLLTEQDLKRPLNIPAECLPKVGKRRRACKDCTCGLAERLATEDAERQADADVKLREVKLGTNDLAEVDFTVQGKVGSCGNCALGDAFRCDGCPYVGLPPFKPGEEVRILNDEVQL